MAGGVRERTASGEKRAILQILQGAARFDCQNTSDPLEEEYSRWKTRKLCQKYAYAFADGTYFTVIYNGQGCKMPILAVVGMSESGEREVLTFGVGDRENEQAWKDLLEDLKGRGVKEIGLWVSHGGQAMLNAITKKFPTSARQRGVMHKMDNVREIHSHHTAGPDQTRVTSSVLSEGPSSG